MLQVAMQVASEPICSHVELHVISASAAEGKALVALEVRVQGHVPFLPLLQAIKCTPRGLVPTVIALQPPSCDGRKTCPRHGVAMLRRHLTS